MGKKIIEADITVGHHGLSVAESMTVRCALNNFLIDMSVDGLGDYEHETVMAEAYRINAISVLKKIHACIENKQEPPHE